MECFIFSSVGLTLRTYDKAGTSTYWRASYQTFFITLSTKGKRKKYRENLFDKFLTSFDIFSRWQNSIDIPSCDSLSHFWPWNVNHSFPWPLYVHRKVLKLLKLTYSEVSFLWGAENEPVQNLKFSFSMTKCYRHLTFSLQKVFSFSFGFLDAIKTFFFQRYRRFWHKLLQGVE